MSGPKLLQRPIFGGVFGRDRYFLATVPVIANGLHSVRFMVIEPAAGAVISVADDKVEALTLARRVIRASEAFSQAGEGGSEPWGQQRRLWPDSELDAGAAPVRLRPVSRRRRDIFAKCEGKCHYCNTPLMLDGNWHVEHMLPRALGGQDEPSNLVAACVRCNLKKNDRTAIEFMADRQGCDE